MLRPAFSIITVLFLTGHLATAQAQQSIVPDINADGRRGEIAREMHARSTEQFLHADDNQDYRISPEEASRHLAFISRKFAHYDKNNDSSLDWQEFLGHNAWPEPKHENTPTRK